MRWPLPRMFREICSLWTTNGRPICNLKEQEASHLLVFNHRSCSLENAFQHSWDYLDTYTFSMFAIRRRVPYKVIMSKGLLKVLLTSLWPQKSGFPTFCPASGRVLVLEPAGSASCSVSSRLDFMKLHTLKLSTGLSLRKASFPEKASAKVASHLGKFSANLHSEGVQFVRYVILLHFKNFENTSLHGELEATSIAHHFCSPA